TPPSLAEAADGPPTSGGTKQNPRPWPAEAADGPPTSGGTKKITRPLRWPKRPTVPPRGGGQKQNPRPPRWLKRPTVLPRVGGQNRTLVTRSRCGGTIRLWGGRFVRRCGRRRSHVGPGSDWRGAAPN